MAMFEAQAQVVIHTVVTHPPGTTYDAEGKPIPPPEHTESDTPTSGADDTEAKDN